MKKAARKAVRKAVKKAAKKRTPARATPSAKPSAGRLRVRLIHWLIDEAEEHAEPLRKAGYDVAAGPVDGGAYSTLRKSPPMPS